MVRTEKCDEMNSSLIKFIFAKNCQDGEAPSVDYCPPTQKHRIDRHHDSVEVLWNEPKFSDNVKVIEISKTNVRIK